MQSNCTETRLDFKFSLSFVKRNEISLLGSLQILYWKYYKSNYTVSIILFYLSCILMSKNILVQGKGSNYSVSALFSPSVRSALTQILSDRIMVLEDFEQNFEYIGNRTSYDYKKDGKERYLGDLVDRGVISEAAQDTLLWYTDAQWIDFLTLYFDYAIYGKRSALKIEYLVRKLLSAWEVFFKTSMNISDYSRFFEKIFLQSMQKDSEHVLILYDYMKAMKLLQWTDLAGNVFMSPESQLNLETYLIDHEKKTDCKFDLHQSHLIQHCKQIEEVFGITISDKQKQELLLTMLCNSIKSESFDLQRKIREFQKVLSNSSFILEHKSRITALDTIAQQWADVVDLQKHVLLDIMSQWGYVVSDHIQQGMVNFEKLMWFSMTAQMLSEVLERLLTKTILFPGKRSSSTPTPEDQLTICKKYFEGYGGMSETYFGYFLNTMSANHFEKMLELYINQSGPKLVPFGDLVMFVLDGKRFELQRDAAQRIARLYLSKVDQTQKKDMLKEIFEVYHDLFTWLDVMELLP